MYYIIKKNINRNSKRLGTPHLTQNHEIIRDRICHHFFLSQWTLMALFSWIRRFDIVGYVYNLGLGFRTHSLEVHCPIGWTGTFGGLFVHNQTWIGCIWWCLFLIRGLNGGFWWTWPASHRYAVTHQCFFFHLCNP